jgi:hypothetical protein
MFIPVFPTFFIKTAVGTVFYEMLSYPFVLSVTIPVT